MALETRATMAQELRDATMDLAQQARGIATRDDAERLAMGAVELAATALRLRDQIINPTVKMAREAV